MKLFLGVLSAVTLACTVASAQNLPNLNYTRRNISFNIINKDSVNLPLSSNFEMIEDSCSQIIRQAHINMRERKFIGKFKDVSRLNPNLVITEGNYTADGLKDGSFISRYLNGTLQSKGNFKNNQFDGKWELYYDDGKPKLTFEANGKDIKIIDNWDAKGVKIIDNGNGNYQLDADEIYWKGKLVNGKPEGTWKAIRKNDKTTLVSETYKNGTFQKGDGPLGAYTDEARVKLYMPELLPYVNAEGLKMSLSNCAGLLPMKKIVTAKYYGGFNAFTKLIQDLVEPYLSKINLTPFDSNLILDGEIDNQGKLVKLQQRSSFDDAFVRGLVRQLNTLPYLEPATVDGKPVSEKFTITFNFNRGSYNFTYQFLPVEVK